ncbi:hypothetical protein ABZ897_41215 [Nonomuraea sp. NPDC046802]|uniref:hypothetical protein n=1 Tax=Nonomuraea sp. NPDC046802 TaxID=3154919 RepID=UPI0033FF681B
MPFFRLECISDGEALPLDLPATPAGLRAWLKLQAERFAEARELAGAEPPALRERTARALDRGRRPSAGDLDALNRTRRVASADLELGWDGGADSRAQGRRERAAVALVGLLQRAGIRAQSLHRAPSAGDLRSMR